MNLNEIAAVGEGWFLLLTELLNDLDQGRAERGERILDVVIKAEFYHLFGYLCFLFLLLL